VQDEITIQHFHSLGLQTVKTLC